MNSSMEKIVKHSKPFKVGSRSPDQVTERSVTSMREINEMKSLMAEEFKSKQSKYYFSISNFNTALL